MKNKLIIISGPTAVGKTALSVELAKRINGEIISADSMQVYRGMDIGSAKITPEQMQGINHHLIDVLNPDEEFNVYIFKQMAMKALEKIYSRNSIPIIAGGTGFYIQALLYDIDFKEENNNSVREKLNSEAKELGNLALYERLKEKDPVYALSLHPNNTKKVIRALEFIELNNKPFSLHNEEERKKESPYDFRYYVLTDKRETIYSNIEKRVDLMFEEGLLEEVRRLYDQGLDKSYISMQGLGYKELIDYFDNRLSLDEAKEKIKLETRHFAKRQLTWFRREKDIIWIDKSEYNSEEEILEMMIGDIQ